ncbi:MAG: hypothetical protein JNL21_35355 [Myxococcales bacterium]|nr:hypothetical protein [Myxococcales bacterium]
MTRETVFPSGHSAARVKTTCGLDTIVRPDLSTISTQRAADHRFGMQSPVVTKMVHTLPSNLARVVERTRSATLNDPLNLLSLASHCRGVPAFVRRRLDELRHAPGTFFLWYVQL